MLDSALKTGVLPIFGSTAPVDACLNVFIHLAIFRKGGLLQLTGFMMISLRLDILFCVQLTITTQQSTQLSVYAFF